MPLELIISSKGKSILVHDGYEFWLKKKALNGNMNWRCTKHQSLKCPVTLVTDSSEIIKQLSIHNHESNREKVMAKNAVGKMKERMNEATTTPGACQAAVIVDLPPSVLMALPGKSLINRTLNRHRHRLRNRDVARALPPLPTDAMFEVPALYKEFLLYDSMETSNESRFLIFGDRQLLQWLRNSNCWFADGTFKVVPSLFYQLYTIHFQFAQGVIPPVLYCLLQDKSGTTYNRLLDAVRELLPNAAPEIIVTDFEKAAMAAFQQKFPSCRVTGCYFHLSQAVLRKVYELGMRREYDNNDELRGMIRCLPALAYVREEDVVDSFELLAESMPQHDCLPELLTYFEHTYVRGGRLRGRGNNYASALFPPDTWNKHLDVIGGVARTNNAVEGWHHALQSLFSCHHPTMWTFLEGLRKDCQLHKASVLQSCAGTEHRPKKKYAALARKITNMVQKYESMDRLLFLQSLAYLSY